MKVKVKNEKAFSIPVLSVLVSQVCKGDKEYEDDQANGQRHLQPKN